MNEEEAIYRANENQRILMQAWWEKNGVELSHHDACLEAFRIGVSLGSGVPFCIVEADRRGPTGQMEMMIPPPPRHPRPEEAGEIVFTVPVGWLKRKFQ